MLHNIFGQFLIHKRKKTKIKPFLNQKYSWFYSESKSPINKSIKINFRHKKVKKKEKSDV